LEAHVVHPASVAVSREHRRAKTDRLDTDLLKRAFLGWLRGERDHCKMVAIPTLQEEDAKRPNRERDCLVAEQSRLINRMKSTLVRLGIRNVNPKLKRAAEHLETLRTPEGGTIPPNTLGRAVTLLEAKLDPRDASAGINSIYILKPLQLEIGRDRFGLDAAHVHDVEVEPQEIEECSPGGT
jgi:transposase